MTRFLAFTLAGPLMAFGDIAPGERRIGHERPGRSMLLGLIAAALGLRREDARHGPLAASLAFAVRVDAPGAGLVDYHTTQTAPARRNRTFATRRAELAIPQEERVTILSQRAYRTDAAFTIVALPLADTPFAPETIAAALEKPALPLHAGRRACPLGLPPAPRILEADGLAGAFDAYDREEDACEARRCLRRLFGLGGGQARPAAVEQAFLDAGLVPDADIRRREMRRDEPVSRTRWQFAPRAEIVIGLPGVAP